MNGRIRMMGIALVLMSMAAGGPMGERSGRKISVSTSPGKKGALRSGLLCLYQNDRFKRKIDSPGELTQEISLSEARPSSSFNVRSHQAICIRAASTP